ncbi:MAG: type II secretion system protein [Elusimicrobia bacterium]|nr:type II secretion system protein [Elusimicrobiota bacterium]
MRTRPRRRNGFTLIEVCVAAMIVAIGATALFAVALSTRRTVAVSPIREQMTQYSRLLMETLKTYVTSDVSNNTGAPNPAAANPWQLCAGDGAHTWALTSGNHNADCLLPTSLTAAPPTGANATLRYAVSVSGGARKITVTMSWTEPD